CTHRGGCACADADLRRSGPPSGDGPPRDRGELAAMKRECVAATLVLFLLGSSPALAWDPFRERDEPPAPSREPDPAPFIAPPPGIYYVTDTYVADVVTSSGPLTTYSTATIHESTGSYARVLDIVGTGASSAFDGSAFNGRRTLGDGRSGRGYPCCRSALRSRTSRCFADALSLSGLAHLSTIARFRCCRGP